MMDRLGPLAKAVQLLVIGLLVVPSGIALAADGGWTTPVSLSSTLIGPSQFPKIASDTQGRLHVVWGENSYAARGVPDAIYYSCHDGTDWSSPVDVLVSPDQASVVLGKLVFLPGDELALLWIGASTLQLSIVPIQEASHPNAWKTTPLFSGLTSSDAFMIVSSSGTLSMAFVESARYDVMFTQSLDLGNSWTEPRTVWSPVSEGYAAEDVSLCVDETGGTIHLVWHQNAREVGWNPDGVWYTRSVDRGASWEDAAFLSGGGSSPNCAYDGDGILHMLWNNAVGSVDGRYHRRSGDDGLSWSEATPILPGLSGRTRAPALTADSGGTLYLLTGAYADRKAQMFASHWQGNEWTRPLSISGDLVSNESPDMVVTGGNRLNAVWHFGSEDSSNIWFATYQTGAPALPFSVSQPQPTPTATATITAQPQATESASDTAGVEEQTVEPIASLEPAQSSAVPPAILGGLAGLFVVLGAVGITLAKRGR